MHSLIHRDLKPQNLLLAPADSSEPSVTLKIASAQPDTVSVPAFPHIKLADFGFARALPAQSMASTLCGSPLYMAPEILRGDRYDAKADLWSLGAILYEMITGRPPFRAQNHIELLRKIERSNGFIRFPGDPIEEILPVQSREYHGASSSQKNGRKLSNIQSAATNPGRDPASTHHLYFGSLGSSPKYVNFRQDSSIPTVPNDLKDLVGRLLRRVPVERISFEELFTHSCVITSRSDGQDVTITSSYSPMTASGNVSVSHFSGAQTYSKSLPRFGPTESRSAPTRRRTQHVVAPFPQYVGDNDAVSQHPPSNSTQRQGSIASSADKHRRHETVVSRERKISDANPQSVPSETSRATAISVSPKFTKTTLAKQSLSSRVIEPPFPVYGQSPISLDQLMPAEPKASSSSRRFSEVKSAKPFAQSGSPITPVKPPVLVSASPSTGGSLKGKVDALRSERNVTTPSHSSLISSIDSFYVFSDDGDEHQPPKSISTDIKHDEIPPMFSQDVNPIRPKQKQQHLGLRRDGGNQEAYYSRKANNIDWQESNDYVVLDKRVVEVNWIADQVSDSSKQSIKNGGDKKPQQHSSAVNESATRQTTSPPVVSLPSFLPKDNSYLRQNLPYFSSLDLHGMNEHELACMDSLNLCVLRAYTVQLLADNYFVELKRRIPVEPTVQNNDDATSGGKSMESASPVAEQHRIGSVPIGRPVEALVDETVSLYVFCLGLYQFAMDLVKQIWEDIQLSNTKNNSRNDSPTTEYQQPVDSNRMFMSKLVYSTLFRSQNNISASTAKEQSNSRFLKNLSICVQWVRDKFNVCLTYADDARSLMDTLPPAETTKEDTGDSVQVFTTEHIVYECALKISQVAALNEMHQQDMRGCEASYHQAILLIESILQWNDIESNKPEGGLSEMNDEDRNNIEKFLVGLYSRVSALKKKTNSAE